MKVKHYRFHAVITSRSSLKNDNRPANNNICAFLHTGDYDVVKTSYYKRDKKYEEHSITDVLYLKKEIRSMHQLDVDIADFKGAEDTAKRILHKLVVREFKELTNFSYKIHDFWIEEENEVQSEEEYRKLFQKGLERNESFDNFKDESSQNFDKWISINPKKAALIESYIKESNLIADEARRNDTYTLHHGIIPGIVSRIKNDRISAEEINALMNMPNNHANDPMY